MHLVAVLKREIIMENQVFRIEMNIKQNLATVDAEYMVGYDAYDDDQYCYVLARKVGGVTEILLNKTCRIRNKEDKDQFEADVNKLAEYFNCEVRGA